ncbi:uncharacterized protein LOC111371729 [Olea europaea var. sylvestris]|uniref:uncharacterized protein LOC111371729 n=1 Tax=Olea europaea var. sylvestris TaxID=158386 RepID=UPI000C1D4E8B|nr:uncharacterized protein LOC111371729 [Olea europaea var. sylvestris]
MEENLDKSGGGKRIQESMEITLRPIELSDVEDFMVWAADDKVTRFCLWDTYTSKEQALNYIKNYAIPHPWLKVICIENRAIGAITVTPGSGFDQCRAELGYVLSYKYWCKGIVTRAVQMVASTIFKEWPHLERLQATVATDNEGSKRVLEKAGFQREGVLRKYIVIKGKTKDVVMFSLLSTDFLV